MSVFKELEQINENTLALGGTDFEQIGIDISSIESTNRIINDATLDTAAQCMATRDNVLTNTQAINANDALSLAELQDINANTAGGLGYGSLGPGLEIRSGGNLVIGDWQEWVLSTNGFINPSNGELLVVPDPGMPVSGLRSPGVGGIMYVQSDDAQDAPAMPGALTVTIDYIKSDGTAAQEVLALNGVTPVPTVAADICNINAASVTTAGGFGFNAGNINIYLEIGLTTLHCRCTEFSNIFRCSGYHVPLGSILYPTVIKLTAPTAAAATIIHGRIYRRLVGALRHNKIEVVLGNTLASFDASLGSILPTPGNGTLEFRVEKVSGSGTEEVSLVVQGFLHTPT
jgi:hypothetical protein